MRIQLAGNIRFGPDPESLTDYSDEISSLVINRTRALVARPPTYGVPKTQQRLGAIEESVTINFFSDQSEPTGFWRECWDATATDAGELYFEATYEDGAVSETNPMFSGYVGVSDLDTGDTVSEWKQQSKTWPARDIEEATEEGS